MRCPLRGFYLPWRFDGGQGAGPPPPPPPSSSRVLVVRWSIGVSALVFSSLGVFPKSFAVAASLPRCGEPPHRRTQLCYATIQGTCFWPPMGRGAVGTSGQEAWCPEVRLPCVPSPPYPSGEKPRTLSSSVVVFFEYPHSPCPWPPMSDW